MRNLGKYSRLCLIACPIYFCTCEQDDSDRVVTNISELKVVESFNYPTIQEVEVKIRILDNQGVPMQGIPINLYIPKNNSADSLGILAEKGFSNAQGWLIAKTILPRYITKIIVSPGYIGLPKAIILDIFEEKAMCVLGGKIVDSKTSITQVSNVLKDLSYKYLGDWGELGKPKYLLYPRNIINKAFLDEINAILPEHQNLSIKRSDYLSKITPSNLTIKDSADVYVNFIHEGTNSKNTLGFYTYPIGSEPSSSNEIGDITIVYPNASFDGSGGALSLGDKVHLGKFGPGTILGWCLLKDAWDGNAVGKENYSLYSNDNLNPETNPSLKRHTILVISEKNNQYIVGFEDIRRDEKDCDQDFNDLVFTVSTNPVDASNKELIPTMPKINDADADGVSDPFDEYTDDALRAYNNYFPSPTGFATLAFEDSWPESGDYDFNDLVIQYQVNRVCNAQNQEVALNIKFLVTAAGSELHNGFGIQLPIAANLIKSVKGYVISQNYINLNQNGTEAGNSLATIIAFDDVYNLFSNNQSDKTINTDKSNPFIVADTITISVAFNTAIEPVILAAIPFNPFLIRNKNREIEIHLPGMLPTNLANTDLFGTGTDASNPLLGRYYKTANNIPWALNLPLEWDYPAEQSSIIKAYSKFAPWAESGGNQYPDWHLNLSGYRNEGVIYGRP